MRAETRLRDVARLPVLIAEQRVQPAIRLAAVAEVVDQLRVPGLQVESIEIQRHALIALQATQEPLRHLPPRGIEHIQSHRQGPLRHRHRCRLHDAAEPPARQHRKRQQVAAPQFRRQPGNAGIGPQIVALHVHMRDPDPLPARHLIPRPHHVPPRPDLDLRRPAQVGQHVRHIQRDGGEGTNLGVQGHGLLRAHAVQGDGARRDRSRVAVLQP